MHAFEVVVEVEHPVGIHRVVSAAIGIELHGDMGQPLQVLVNGFNPGIEGEVSSQSGEPERAPRCQGK